MIQKWRRHFIFMIKLLPLSLSLDCILRILMNTGFWQHNRFPRLQTRLFPGAIKPLSVFTQLKMHFIIFYGPSIYYAISHAGIWNMYKHWLWCMPYTDIWNESLIASLVSCKWQFLQPVIILIVRASSQEQLLFSGIEVHPYDLRSVLESGFIPSHGLYGNVWVCCHNYKETFNFQIFSSTLLRGAGAGILSSSELPNK